MLVVHLFAHVFFRFINKNNLDPINEANKKMVHEVEFREE